MKQETTKSFLDLDPKERSELVQRQLAERIRYYEKRDRERAARRARRQRWLRWLPFRRSR
jgi:hypothetical protein